MRSLLLGGLMTVSSLSPAVAQDPSAAPPSDHLAAALALAPADATYVGFTDWSAMKAARDLEFLNSAAPEGVRLDAMIGLAREEATFAAEVLQHFVGHAEAWGWDASDLDWEANFSGAGAPVAVLHFRDDLDLAPFIDRFDERGFDARPYGDATIREHEFDVTADWFRSTSIAMRNTALLPDGRTIVMSGSPEALEAVLDVAGAPGTGLLATAPAVELVTRLGEPISAAVEIGVDPCVNYGPRIEEGVEPVDGDLLAEVGSLAAWEALSLATYGSTDGKATGRLTLAFPDADDAGLDIERAARERLAREGHSSRGGAPYAEAAFDVTASAGSDGTVSLELSPIDDRNAVFVAAVFARDLLPAMCT